MTSHCNNKTLFLIEHGTNIHFIGLQDGDAHDQNRKNETWHTLANDSGSIDLGIWTSIYNFGDKWQYNTIHQTSYDAFKMNESPISLKLILNQLKTLYFSSFFGTKSGHFYQSGTKQPPKQKTTLTAKLRLKLRLPKFRSHLKPKPAFSRSRKVRRTEILHEKHFFRNFFDIPMRN